MRLQVLNSFRHTAAKLSLLLVPVQEQRDAVGLFFKSTCRALGSAVCASGPVAAKPGLKELLGRLFLCEPAGGLFLKQYGAVAQVNATPFDMHC